MSNSKKKDEQIFLLLLKFNFIGKYFGNFVQYNHLNGLSLAGVIMNPTKYCTRIISMWLLRYVLYSKR